MWKNSSWVLSFSGDELDVVYQKDVAVEPVEIPELVHRTCFYALHHPVCEVLGGYTEGVQAVSVPFEYVISYRVEKVGFPEAHATVYEKRVISHPGVLGYRERGGVSELIAWSDDEVLKRVG